MPCSLDGIAASGVRGHGGIRLDPSGEAQSVAEKSMAWQSMVEQSIVDPSGEARSRAEPSMATNHNQWQACSV